MYVVQFPGEKLPPSAFDYEAAMNEAMWDQMKGLKDVNLEKEMKDKYN